MNTICHAEGLVTRCAEERPEAEPPSQHAGPRRNGHPRGGTPPTGSPSPPGSSSPPRKRPRRGSGQLQWNTWGWFGGQVGSSIWLLALGIVAAANGDALGAAPIALCLLANLVGTLLWVARDRVAPLAALQILLATLTVLSAAGVAIILEGQLLGTAPELPPGRWVYLYLLIFPALMLQLWAVDQAGRGRPRGGQGGRHD